VLTHLDLFSGVGGFSLAAKWVGFKTIGFVEIDKYCQQVLRKHWPDVPIVEDINNVEEIKQIVENSIISRCPHRETKEEGTEVREQWKPVAGDGNRIHREKIIANTTVRGLEKQGLRYGDKQSAQQDKIDRQIQEDDATNSNGNRPQIKRAEQQASGDRQHKTLQRELGRSNWEQNSTKLLLTGGFPCQPFSQAGRRKGSHDNRYLWPQTLAVIEAIKPDWVILENVAGLLSMVFPDSAVGVANQASLYGDADEEICDYDTICGRIESDLREAGYETVWLVIPACAVSAPHRRDRVWIVGNSQRKRLDGTLCNTKPSRGIQQEFEERCRTDGKGIVADTKNSLGWPRQYSRGEKTEWAAGYNEFAGDDRTIPNWSENWYEVATRFCRMDDGVPNRVDRLKALGNAIVPQVAYQILKGIAEIENL